MALCTSFQRGGGLLIGVTGSGWWPTPRACNLMAMELSGKVAARGRSNLEGAVAKSLGLFSGGSGGRLGETRIGGRLNPRWIEWLMGYPDSFTDREPSGTQ